MSRILIALLICAGLLLAASTYLFAGSPGQGAVVETPAETPAGTPTGGVGSAAEKAMRSSLQLGKPPIVAMSTLTFSPGGLLFIGDGKSGAVFVIDLGERPAPAEEATTTVRDLEAKAAAMLGVSAGEVMVHDLATDPVTQDVYLAVSRGRAAWQGPWTLPNEVADAHLLLKVQPDGTLRAVDLERIPFARAALPNPVAPEKPHEWKEGVKARVDTITDMAWTENALFVTGLSNEEFSATMWKLPLPFRDGTSATTLEIYHGAHGKYETEAPIRTFVPFVVNGEEMILASFLCTPFVTFKASEMEHGRHLKGRTIGEFGSGNYPLDMVVVGAPGDERVLIANSSLPLTLVKVEDIASFAGEITERPSTYVAGVPHEIRSGGGILQLDRLNPGNLITLRRMPNGTLDLEPLPLRRG